MWMSEELYKKYFSYDSLQLKINVEYLFFRIKNILITIYRYFLCSNPKLNWTICRHQIQIHLSVGRGTQYFIYGRKNVLCKKITIGR